GEVGAYVALGALLLVGLVVAANRTIAELFVPIWRQRPAIGGLKPGTMIPGGTATRFDRVTADEDERPEQMRIHIPEERNSERPRAEAAQPPRAGAGAPEREAPSRWGAGPVRRREERVSEAEPPKEREPFAVSNAGLASAAVAAEGVLHAEPPEKPWVLPAIDQLDQGSAARSGKD